MINLDQVRTLEWKVKQAVQLIVHLRRENDTLRGRISDTEVRLQELEALLESFKATQNEMESGIRSALEELDNLEGGDAVQASGPVDPLAYPPIPAADEAAFAAEDPAEIFEKSPVPEVQAADLSFEEEYAALAAAEAEVEAEVEAVTSEQEEVYETAPLPESVELEEAFSSEAEPEPAVPEEKEPEQPGLGIF